MANIDRERKLDWASEENYWRENYRTRPYTDETRGFDFYRPGYRYGYESAERLGRRPWEEAEPELRRDWDRYEGRGESTWDDIKDSVKDAWHRITGSGDRPR
ncbi:MAG TPA: hypothetical protein VK939_00110 [Longimicrobiales bacterium]|nr:hypothetical protein [Longimicrobiales bacterium]